MLHAWPDLQLARCRWWAELYLPYHGKPHGVGAGTEVLGSCPKGEMGDVLAFP
jgi:hypothetical protein